MTVSASKGLAEVYERYFRVLPADTPGLLAEAFRLRYQVYCLENGFEDPARFPDGLETDAYDAQAVHSLLVHRPTSVVAGTVRLVLPRPGVPDSLPIHAHCHVPLPSPPATTGEVSRFSISKDFRRRRTDGIYPDEHLERLGAPRADARLIPSMTLGLIQDLVRMSAENGVTHWCAVMMPSLLRLLGRLGIHFVPLGPLVEFRGKRQPCYRDLDDLLAQVRAEQPEVWSFLTKDGTLWPATRRPASVAMG